MTLYVGIDQSYSGFGLVAYDPATRWFAAHLGQFPKAKFGEGIKRLVIIEEWLYDHIIEWDVDHGGIGLACMEGYAPGAKFGREVAGELGAITKRALYTANLNLAARYPTIVQPSLVKKFVLGKGAGGKNEMLLGVYKRWGVEFDNDNLADAYSLARIAAAVANAEKTEHKYQQEVLSKL